MIELAIGFGLFLNLVSYEFIGLTAGGAVVPGYLALFLEQPGRIAATVAAAGITVVGVRLLGRVTILYGRRKFAVTLLIGFLVNVLVDGAGPWLAAWLGPSRPDVRVIGFIVPGLMANEMDRQGVVATVAISLIAAVLVRVVVNIALRMGAMGGV